MIRKKIEKLIEKVVKKGVHLEHPANAEFGDYSTNLALIAKIDPEKIVSKLKDNPLFEKVTVAGPGFINFFLSRKALQKELAEVLKQGNNYGQLRIGKNKKVQVEFISANPTGPLTVANARGGPFGDVLANVLKKAGYQAEKAYYVNDAGQQIIDLGQGKYKSEYLDNLKNKINQKNLARYIIKDSIKPTTKRLGIEYDEWIFESDLYKSGQVEKTLKCLRKKDLIYSKDKAEWFKSSKFGDQRDRVVVKKDGRKTYLAGDIALHRYKFEDKKFDQVINVWGADHHGDVPGLMAGVEAFGHKNKLKIILLQFVTILEKGVKQKMSKRAGTYVEMDELLDKVGPDVVRFFFLQKTADTHLNFDLKIAKEQSAKNPVYYVQYAHARIHSILAKSKIQNPNYSELKLLTHPAESNLIRKIIEFPEIIEETARDYQVQRLPYYSLELANAFHRFYERCPVLGNPSRIALTKATQIVLKNTLKLMGISAPEKM